MTRSTKAEKAKQLNTAHRLLQRGMALPDAAERLSQKFDLSERQAYRYLEEAAQQFRTSVEIYSELSAWSSLGKIYNSQEVSDKAEEAWRHVLEFERFSPSAHRSLGQIYLSRQQWKAAEGEFQACLLLDPADPVALAGLKKIQNFAGAQALPGSKN